MKISQLLGTAAVVLLTAGMSCASAATIYSENFSDPGFVGTNLGLTGSQATSDRWASTTYYTINSTDGWTFTGGTYLATDTPDPTHAGLLLNENGPTTAITTISGLTTGQTYDVRLLVFGDNEPGGQYTLGVSMGGSSIGSTTGTDVGPGAYGGAYENYEFVASGSSEQLMLTEASLSDEASPIVTNLSISAVVPEPATWAMMLFGFAGAGFMMRGARRKQHSAIATA